MGKLIFTYTDKDFVELNREASKIEFDVPDDMDINAGTILDGVETVEECGQRIFERIIAVASGERTKSELLGYGEEEFCPWDLGIML